MAAHAAAVGLRPAICSSASRRRLASIGGLGHVIRLGLAAALLVLSLGLAGTVTLAGADAMPPDGPAPGLDL